MDQGFIRLNVAMILPEEIATAVISLGKSLGEKYDTHFVLDGATYHPHITLYSPEYPVPNLEKMVNAVENISKEFNLRC